MERLKKREDETQFEYIIRITNGKKDKSLDIDYVEWSELIYGKAYSSDVARRMFYGVERFISIYEEEKELIHNIDDSEIIQKIEEKKKELRLERKKVQAEKSELNRYENKKSKYEAYYENIASAIEKLPNPKFKDISICNNEKAYVLQFSDVHYGATFKTITNEYSREICKERFNKLLFETIDFVKNNDVHELYIVNNADSLQGMLRISDIKINDVAVVDALVEFQKLIAEFLNRLSEYCYVRYYQVQTANHTELRLLNSKAGQMANEDMEKIIVNYLNDVLEDNERVFINTEFKEDNLQFNVLEYEIIALHGHTIKNQKTALKDKSNQYKKFFDYMLIGHFHNGMELTVGEKETHSLELLCSPSFVGSCPYSDTLHLGSKSMAKIYTFESGKGHTDSKIIILN